MCLFHKWEYLYDTIEETFLNEKYDKPYVRFRRCKKCGIIQEYDVDHLSWDMWWRPLNKQEIEILEKKIAQKKILTEKDKETIYD